MSFMVLAMIGVGWLFPAAMDGKAQPFQASVDAKSGMSHYERAGDIGNSTKLVARVLMQSSDTPDPSEPAPTPTHTPLPPFTRPMIVLDSYSIQGGQVKPGQEFSLNVRLANIGGSKARNIVVIFSSGDFLPRVNGGVLAAGVIAAGASTGYTQPLTASIALQAGAIASLPVQVNYTDDSGIGFSESFNITLVLGAQKESPARSAIPTPTPAYRPQLLIIGYQVDQDQLTPGSRFRLVLELLNVGGSAAQRVTMILGGGRTSQADADSSNNDGTGTAGGGGDFSKIAPIGSSNVQFLGDIPAGEEFKTSQTLIVNSKTEPGAYQMLITLSYTDEKNRSYIDDQVVTLLVYSPPALEIEFSRVPEPLFIGQPGILPIQVINLGSSSVILGKMTVRSDALLIENGSMMIGYLDAGGYFPLEAMVFPEQTGLLELDVEVLYLDDFNQPQIVQKSLSVEVVEGMPFEQEFPGDPGMEPSAESEETFFQRLWRFVRGLLGLGSGKQVMETQLDGVISVEVP